MSRVAVKDNEYHKEFNYNTVVIATSDPFTDEGQWNSIPINYYYKILGIVVGTRDPESRDTNNFLSNKKKKNPGLSKYQKTRKLGYGH